MQWIDEPDSTSSDGIGKEDLGVKPGEDGSAVRRGALQLNAQELELELEKPPASQKRREGGTGGAVVSRGGDKRGAVGSRGGAIG